MSRKIIIKQHQSPGDILTLTACIRDLKLSYPGWSIDVRCPAREIFDNNPHITTLTDEEAEVVEIKYDEINDCGWVQEHWTNAYRHDMEKKLEVKIKKTSILPELYISDLEKSWTPQVEGDYWVINAGRKQDNELKQYHRWQEVVTLFNDYFKYKVKLVQIGHEDHVHPDLKGVTNLVGKTDTRQLIRLMYWAKGSVGPLSFHYVISAALKQPSVCVMGGKEDVRWHLYPHIRYLYTNGTMPCCEWGGCWLGGDLGKCENQIGGVPKCFALITPYDIFKCIRDYYDGGIL